VSVHAPEWLQTIKRIFFTLSGEDETAEQQENRSSNNETLLDSWGTYETSFGEQNYSKNVVGAMKESAFLSSHGSGAGSGLSAVIVGDILWSLWNSLFSSIKLCLERDLSEIECNLLVQQVLQAELPLIDLWRETARQSKNGSIRQGILPTLWKEENEREQTRLQMIKARGVDARWGQLPRTSIATPQESLKKPDLKILRSLLEEKLQFRFKY